MSIGTRPVPRGDRSMDPGENLASVDSAPSFCGAQGWKRSHGRIEAPAQRRKPLVNSYGPTATAPAFDLTAVN
jgi:hypothetical protein